MKPFAANAEIIYILEERLWVNPHEVHFAWSFKTQGSAEEKLLQLMRAHGHLAAYSMYCEVE